MTTVGVRTRRRTTMRGWAPRQRPNETDAEFEARVNRTEGGKFTAGADANGPNGSTPSTGPAPGEPALGTTGGAALGLIQVLRLLGSAVDEATTVGPEVVAELVAAQRELGVEGENGFLGPKTRAAIRQRLGIPDSSGQPDPPARPATGDTARRDRLDAEKRERTDRLDRERTARQARQDAAKAERDAAADARRAAADAARSSARTARAASKRPKGGQSRRRTRKGSTRKNPPRSGRWDRLKNERRRKTTGKKPGGKLSKWVFGRTITVKRGTMGGMEHKSLGGTPVEIVDEVKGIAQALVSVTGVVDAVNDVIVPGAYEKTLKVRTPKGVDAHSWEKPVAKALSIKEMMPGDPGLPKLTPDGSPWPAEAGGLGVVAQFNLKTQAGRDAFENVRFFDDQAEWSIGYQVPRGAATVKDGKRYIKEMDLFEFSPVLFGAMPMARTTSVKGLRLGDVEEKRYSNYPGSFEHTEELVRRALRDLQPTEPTDDDTVVGDRFGVSAMFPSYVIVSDWSDNDTMYRVSYSVVNGSAVLGDLVPVDVTTVVTPVSPETPDHLTDYDPITAEELAAMSALRAYT